MCNSRHTVTCELGKIEQAIHYGVHRLSLKGRGRVIGAPGWTPPAPAPKTKGSCDGTPQTNPGTSEVSMERGDRGGVPGGRGGGRGLEGEGGTYLR